MLKNARGAINTIFFRKPLNARFWLTARCNYSCSMCGVKGVMGDSPELSFEQLVVAEKNLTKLGVSQVVFTGGDPLLRRDIVDILSLFRKSGRILRIQTNAGPHVTKELMTRCYEAGLDDVSISFDTCDVAKQDAICCASDVLMSTVEILRYCAERYAKKSIIVANVVFSAKNFFETPAIVSYLWNTLGVFIAPCIYMRQFGASSIDPQGHSDEYSLLSLEKNKAIAVVDELISLKRSGAGIVTTTRILRDLRTYFKTGSCRWKCRAGELHFDIMPSGELAACCDSADIARIDPVANVCSESFMEQYRSQAFQDKLVERRRECLGCLYGCYRDPTYLATDPWAMWDAFCTSIRVGKLFH